jgi:hypothetical protein
MQVALQQTPPSSQDDPLPAGLHTPWLQSWHGLFPHGPKSFSGIGTHWPFWHQEHSSPSRQEFPLPSGTQAPDPSAAQT